MDNSNDNTDSIINPLSDIGPNFKPLTLKDIQSRIKALMDKLPLELPPVPDEVDAGNGNHHDGDNNHYDSNNHNDRINNTNNSNNHHSKIKSFASNLQTTIEEFNLLLSLVSSATYQWGVDRSGASQQNLSVMSAELQQCQEVIGSVVSSRLSNVLCPSVDIVVGSVSITSGHLASGASNVASGHASGASNTPSNMGNLHNNTANIREQRINHYTRPYVDPNYVHLCHLILARNAPMIRHVVASCLHSAQKVIGDYLKAAMNDVNHGKSGNGYTF